MIDYGPFKLIYMCVHIDRICQFEQFIIVTRRNRQTDSEYITLYGDHVSFISLYTSISFNDPLSGRIKALCCVFFYLLPNLAPPNLGHHLCNSLVPRIYCSMLGIDRSF